MCHVRDYGLIFRKMRLRWTCFNNKKSIRGIMQDLSRMFNPRFSSPKQARDLIVEQIYDRSMLIVFPMDDLFPKQGYTYRELGKYMTTHIDLDTLQRHEGVKIFCTSEEQDRITFQTSIKQARDRGSVIVMLTNNPIDTVILDRKDVLLFYGDGAAKTNISRTRHVAYLPDFHAACDALGWLRYDMERSRYRIPFLEKKNRIDWTQYPDVEIRP